MKEICYYQILHSDYTLLLCIILLVISTYTEKTSQFSLRTQLSSPEKYMIDFLLINMATYLFSSFLRYHSLCFIIIKIWALHQFQCQKINNHWKHKPTQYKHSWHYKAQSNSDFSNFQREIKIGSRNQEFE